MKALRANPGLVLLLALVAGSAALLRMGQALAPWDANPYGVTHHYEYLTEGFLSGHTYLSQAPTPDIAAMGNPIAQARDVSHKLVDASLYQGRYYLYYGPTPAVLLMAPLRIVTGHMLPQRLAVVAFAVAGLAALALLLWEVRRRHFPEASSAALAWAFLVAMHASWLPVVVRRPYFWELAIVAAVACLWWGLYFLWKFHESGGRARWAVAAGIALGFMIGARATCVFAAGAVLAFIALPRTGAAPGRSWNLRAGAMAAALVAAAGLGLLAYNQARFGHPLEFGQSFQLWGDDYRGSQFFSPRYVFFNAWLYLLSAAAPGPYFPFVAPVFPSGGPVSYMGLDEIHGALIAIPAQLIGIAAVVGSIRRWRDARSRPLVLTMAAGVAASLCAAAVLFCWGGACSRYVAELWAGWTGATAVAVLAIFGSGLGGRWNKALRIGAALLGAWTIGYVWLASMDYSQILRRSRPGEYSAIARVLDYPSFWWARARGVTYGPVDLEIRIPAPGSRMSVPLVTSGRPDRMSMMVLSLPGDGRATIQLMEGREGLVLSTPAFPVRGEVVHVRLEAPWLYPPADSPYWDGVPDPSLRRSLRSRFALKVDGEEGVEASGASEDAAAFSPWIAREGTSQVAWIGSIRPAPPAGR